MADELHGQADRRRGSPDRRHASIDLRRRDLAVAERRLALRRIQLVDHLFTLAQQGGVSAEKVEELTCEFRALETAYADLATAYAAVRERRALPYGRRADDSVEP